MHPLELARWLSATLLFLACFQPVAARENIAGKTGAPARQFRTAEACLPATSTSTLDINNVRTLLQNGGDMWWDLVAQPRYEVPKVVDPANARHSLFAGSLWIGGIDGSGVLRIAAQTYRQSGNDFFPGPLNEDGTVERNDCNAWNRHFKINKAEIDAFRSDATRNLANYPNVASWPGIATIKDKDGFPTSIPMAPFWDENNDQRYNPADGDYPLLFEDLKDVVPDQMVFWVINDMGDIHTETKGEQIGVEIKVHAFAFSTTNEINDMTFYKYNVKNKSTNVLRNAYIGQWVDADLGFYNDDYVGCDTLRGLGICYNGTANDIPLTQGYGLNPPAVGVDFFQGPLADPNDSLDNNKDGRVDEEGERWGMAKFIYYNNDFSIIGNPEQATHFYGYLSGFWKNGAPVVDDRPSNGGNGNGFPDPGEQGVQPTNYMFPDYPGRSCGFASPVGPNPWNEASSGNTPFDRRFIQSAGPFTLLPGAENEIVIGVVWARDRENAFDVQQFGSVCKLLRADDIAQRLFDVRFDLLDGPDAPFLSITPLDRELILTWDYTAYGDPSSVNNYYENYREADPVLLDIAKDPFFEFEGYIVYQLLNDQVSAAELGDRSKARIVAQCDIKNNVSTIINRNVLTIPGVDGEVIQDEVMVEGANKGIFRSIKVTEDLFATGEDKQLVNYRDYFYTVVAYAHNEETSDGRRYLQGNGRFALYKTSPHKIRFERGGLELNGQFGEGIEVTRISGQGSGGQFIEFTPQTTSQILSQNIVRELAYQASASPITVFINNPKELKGLKYRLVVTGRQFVDRETIPSPFAGREPEIISRFKEWELFDITSGTPRSIYTSYFTISSLDPNRPTPQPMNGTAKPIIELVAGGQPIDHGISIGIQDVPNPGNVSPSNPGLDTYRNGVVGSDLIFANPNQPWINFFSDFDNLNAFNWIRSGPGSLREVTSEQRANIDFWDRGFAALDSASIARPRCPDGDEREQCFRRVLRKLDSSFVDGRWIYRFDSIRLRVIDTIRLPRSADTLALTYRFYDPNEDYEKILQGGWAPYVMTAYFHVGRDIAGPSIRIAERWAGAFGEVAPDQADPRKMLTLNKLFNVNVVITPDQRLWSRCVVVETSPARNLGSGAHIMTAKWRKSRGINETNYVPAVPSSLSEEYGMSWFPGYAINMDTGERLNIFFGESTWHKDLNGDDMLFNPSDNTGLNLRGLFGRHYIYVTNTRYDECRELARILRVNLDWITKNAPSSNHPILFAESNAPDAPEVNIQDAYGTVGWTCIPQVFTRFLYRSYSEMPQNPVTVRIRVNRSFETENDTLPKPTFEFDTRREQPIANNTEIAKSALDLIQVVPNPYYGASGTGRGRYERTQLDTRVKLTNLPQRCDIRIFTLNGSLVRVFRKNSDQPSLEWDLKNDNGVPIASGMYIIYIDAAGLGEKTLKFFCVLPRPDLNAY
jgi:hypothetical protein